MPPPVLRPPLKREAPLATWLPISAQHSSGAYLRPLTSPIPSHLPPIAVYKKEVPLTQAKAINGLRAVFGEVRAI